MLAFVVAPLLLSLLQQQALAQLGAAGSVDVEVIAPTVGATFDLESRKLVPSLEYAMKFLCWRNPGRVAGPGRRRAARAGLVPNRDQRVQQMLTHFA